MAQSCGCGTVDKDEARRLWMTTFEAIGFREIAEQTLGLQAVVSASVRYLRKAERAGVLGLAPGIVAMDRAAAERENRQAARQVRAVQERLRHQLNRPEFTKHVSAMDETIRSEEGQTVLRDMGERWIEWTYESDLSAPDAREAVDTWNKATGAVQGGIVSLLSWFDDVLSEAAQARNSRALGTEPHSPLTTNQWICIAAITALTIISAIACAGTPWCWCCYGWAIALAAAASYTACAFIR
jgi:hypothetical protein